jgi:uncharacterized protein YjbJ (UPF0337 family)
VSSRFSRRVPGNGKEDPIKETIEMEEQIDEAKGRAKEAVGDLTDDEELKREGKVDRAVSSVKEKVDQAADKIKDRIGRDSD